MNERCDGCEMLSFSGAAREMRATERTAVGGV